MNARELLRLSFGLITGSIVFTSGCNQNQGTDDTLYLQDTLAIRQGEGLFTQYCASCHNFKANDIGPSLNHVTSEESHDWLVSFVKNAPELINSGDKRAKELYDTYQVFMPSFDMLSEENIEAILAYVHAQQNDREVKKRLAGGIRNPVEQKVKTSDLSLVLEDFITLPATAEVAPRARVNKMSHIRTGKGQRLFIHDLRGKVYEIKGNSYSVFMDMAAEEENFIDNPGMGTGLGSIAFHPEFAKNGLFYTTHTEPKGTKPADYPLPDSIPVVLQSVLVERKMDNPTAGTYSGTGRELLRADMYSGIHGFQDLNFNPTAKPGEADYGLLYLGIGEGGATLGGYPQVCDLSQIWGKVIRIDPAGKNSTNGQYGIPSDNPFASGDQGALREAYAYGFRNPHRITWDQSGKHMLISDIGQQCVEELNLGKSGANYGWPSREGTFVFNLEGDANFVYPLPANDPEAYTYPVAQYDHAEGFAIIGGFVYEKNDIPALKGKYVFGDITTGKIYFVENDDLTLGKQQQIYSFNIRYQGKDTDLKTLNQDEKVSLRFGVDGSGNLYVMTKSDGKIYKVADCVQNNVQASASK